MKKSSAGQVQMSFGMIFSIILIIVFLAFAFYAIRIFLNMQNNAQIGEFMNNFQADINRIWGGSVESSEEQEYSLPKKVSSVCFVDFSVSGTGMNTGLLSELRRGYYGNENLVVYPTGSSDIESIEINNIDLYLITRDENPFCVEIIKGKLKLTLIKEFGGNGLVSVTR